MAPRNRPGDRSSTRNRVVRLLDDIWFGAHPSAVQNGERISEVIRRALIDYAGMSGTSGVNGRRGRITRPKADAVDSGDDSGPTVDLRPGRVSLLLLRAHPE